MSDYDDMVEIFKANGRPHKAYKEIDYGFTIEIEHWMGGTEYMYFDNDKKFEDIQIRFDIPFKN